MINTYRYFLLLLFVLFVPALASAQREWNAVEQLPIKTSIIVTTTSGNEIKGKIASITVDDINLRAGNRSIALRRDEVASIHHTRRGSRLKRALIGAAVGAGIGFGVGAIAVASTKTDGLVAAAGVLYGAPTGAVIGALTAKKKRGRLIYIK